MGAFAKPIPRGVLITRIRASSQKSETDLEGKDTVDKDGGAQLLQNAADSLGVSLGASGIFDSLGRPTRRTLDGNAAHSRVSSLVLQDPLVSPSEVTWMKGPTLTRRRVLRTNPYRQCRLPSGEIRMSRTAPWIYG